MELQNPFVNRHVLIGSERWHRYMFNVESVASHPLVVRHHHSSSECVNPSTDTTFRFGFCRSGLAIRGIDARESRKQSPLRPSKIWRTTSACQISSCGCDIESRHPPAERRLDQLETQPQHLRSSPRVQASSSLPYLGHLVSWTSWVLRKTSQ